MKRAIVGVIVLMLGACASADSEQTTTTQDIGRAIGLILSIPLGGAAGR